MRAPLLLPIVGVFIPPSGGVLVVGYCERGEVKAGDAVALVGLDRAPRQVVVAEVWPGELSYSGPAILPWPDHLALLLPDLQPGEVERGQVLATPGSVQTHKLFRARIRLLKGWYGSPVRALRGQRRLQIVIHGGDYDGIVNLPPGMAQLDPGEESELAIELLHTTVLEPGCWCGYARVQSRRQRQHYQRRLNIVAVPFRLSGLRQALLRRCVRLRGHEQSVGAMEVDRGVR